MMILSFCLELWKILHPYFERDLKKKNCLSFLMIGHIYKKIYTL